jgi:hypothetical protein
MGKTRHTIANIAVFPFCNQILDMYKFLQKHCYLQSLIVFAARRAETFERVWLLRSLIERSPIARARIITVAWQTYAKQIVDLIGEITNLT